MTATPSTSRVHIGDVITPRNDIIHPRDNPTGSDVFVGLEHIESGTGRRIGSENVEKSELTGRKARFRAGDIVYGYLRPYLNKVWLADSDGLCSVDQYVYVVDERQADAEYIAWFMRSPLFLSRAPVDSGPGQLPRIRLDEIAQVELDLFPLPEQKRVAAALREQMDGAARLRTAAKAQTRAIETHFRTAVQEFFEGDEASQYSMVPLQSIVSKVGSGSTPRGGQAAYRESGVPLIRSQNVHMNRFEDDGLVFLSHAQDLEMQGTRVLPGDILLNITGASIGRVCVVPDRICPANVNQHVSIIRTGVEADPRFVSYYLSCPRFQSWMMGTQAGATRQALTKAQVLDFRIPLPRVVRQRVIADDLDAKWDASGVVQATLAKQAAEIHLLPAALLRTAFSGGSPDN